MNRDTDFIVKVLSKGLGVECEVRDVENSMDKVIVQKGASASNKTLKFVRDETGEYNIITQDGESILTDKESGLVAILFMNDVEDSLGDNLETALDNGVYFIVYDDTPEEVLQAALIESMVDFDEP